jgi:Holliday junction DNA helicase RuvA
MIVGLKGKIVYKEPSFVHVEVSGVVYEVFISLQTFGALMMRYHSLHLR